MKTWLVDDFLSDSKYKWARNFSIGNYIITFFRFRKGRGEFKIHLKPLGLNIQKGCRKEPT